MKIFTSSALRQTLAVLLGGFTLVMVPAFALANGNDAESGKAMMVRPIAAPSLSISIDQNDNALVRGAKVQSVSGSTITATTAWNSAVLTWTVNTSGPISFVNGNGATTSLSSIAVGDTVSFNGPIATGASAFTVNAKVVRDWSGSANPVSGVTLLGTASNINASAGTFTLNTFERGAVTVTTNGSTAYTSPNGTVGFGNIGLNSYVTVTGTYDATAKAVTATTINFPALPKPIALKNFFDDIGGKLAGFFGKHS